MARNKYPEETIKLILEEALKLFIDKGYENTSIQDIISNLGGLSKGAIYHHFKSKEEIFEAVCKKIGNENKFYYDKIRDDQDRNGYEKLKATLEAAYANPNNEAVIAMTSKILSDPKFLMNQINEIYSFIVPQYMQPIIEEGVRDGSIKTDYPKELAEVITTLMNIWINPVITKTTPEEMRSKMNFLQLMLQRIGIDIIDEKIIEECVIYCEQFAFNNMKINH